MGESYSLGLIGYPLLHSLSPRLHMAALRQMALAGDYRLYPVEPGVHATRDLSRLMERARAGEIHGLNVTIPHKQTVIPLLDDLTPQASAIGAVNTILVRDGYLVGDNTDAPGFLSDLQRVMGEGGIGMLGRTEAAHRMVALVLGAGGAARAVVYALLAAGCEVIVAARRFEQAEALQQSFQISFPGAYLLAVSLQNVNPTIHNLPSAPTLLVNATSAGMLGRTESAHRDVETSPWPDGQPFPGGIFVYDLVYKPPETALLRAARRAGLHASNGLGMLVEQAALALEKWTGQSVPRQAMAQAVAEFAGHGPMKNSP